MTIGLAFMTNGNQKNPVERTVGRKLRPALGIILLLVAVMWGCCGFCIVPPFTVIGGSEGHVTAKTKQHRQESLHVTLPVWFGGLAILAIGGFLLLRPKP